MTYTPDPAATYTTNYTLEKPSHGSHDGTWEQWIASAFDMIDAAIAAAAAAAGTTPGPKGDKGDTGATGATGAAGGITDIRTIKGYARRVGGIPAFSVVHCYGPAEPTTNGQQWDLASYDRKDNCNGIIGINLAPLVYPQQAPPYDNLTVDVVVYGVVENPAWNLTIGIPYCVGLDGALNTGGNIFRFVGWPISPTKLWVCPDDRAKPAYELGRGEILTGVIPEGDIGYGAYEGGLHVGTDGQILSLDSTETTGLKWVDPPTAVNGSPTLLPGQCSTSIAVGSVVHAQPQVMGSFLNWELAEPTTVSELTIVGIVQANGTSASVAIAGLVPIPETSIAVGYPVWLGAGGTLSDSPTGTVPRLLGWVVDSTHLLMHSDPDPEPTTVTQTAGTKTTYRSSLTAVDKITKPTITAAASATAGSLTNVAHGITVVCKSAYGLTDCSTIVTATPTASTSIDVTIPAVTGAISYEVFLSTSTTAPLRVAEITETQRAAGCAVTAVNTVGAGGSAGVVNVRVVGTGLACTDSSYSTNYAYLPDPITSIDCTGKSAAYVWVDFTVTSGTGFVSVTPFLYVGSAWVRGLSETLSLKYPSEHQLVLDLNAATGLKVLINTISGTGASTTISYTLVSQGLT